jgi:hypothetical protein
MNGETESSISATPISLAVGRSKKRDNNIQNYEVKVGLPSLPENKDRCSWLEITGQEVSKMSPDELDEAATDLAAYGIYIQRTLSKERGILRWLDSRINLSIASELNNYTGYYSHDQRRAVAVVNNSYAKELEEMKINSQLKVDLLDGLTFQINQLCRVLLEAKNKKRM